MPACEGLSCGSDGCGGTCGTCGPGDECTDGACVQCQPKCDGKECGPDGCGDSCGNCEGGGLCGPEQTCVDCIPQCLGKICGDDGCGGSCGDCGVDCNNLAAGPFSLDKLDGPIASEDLAFDDQGNVVGSNDHAIFKSAYGGDPQVWIPNIDFRAGLRFIPSGDLMVNNDNTGQLLRIEPDGTINVVLNNLKYPNGLAVDLNGFVYVTEHDNERVIKVDPYTQESWIISDDEIQNPNGAAFSPDYRRLFVAGFSGVGTIYAFEVDEEGNIGPSYPWATDVGTGWLDGIAVDACGNLYIADYYATAIYRFPPDGSSYTTVASGSNGAYLPNMQWGSGIGGWDTMKLYLPDGWKKGVFELDIGVPGPPPAYP